MWLRGQPGLAEMREAFPEEWERVSEQVATLVRRGEPDRLVEQLKELTTPRDPTPGRMPSHKALVAEAVRARMLTEAVRRAMIAADTGVSEGTLRLGLVNGFVLQRLLFHRDLHRKPVNYLLFRTLWPVLPERRRLMPLVMPQGIYCFYARPLLRAIHRLAADRRCLEIAAGDGALTQMLAARGTRIVATDDHSWNIDVRGGTEPHGTGPGGTGPDGDRSTDVADGVESLDAVTALRRHSPEVVVCSWPPPGNTFERHVFTTPSVQLYVLLTSSHRSRQETGRRIGSSSSST